jgi:hypothetical protein
MAHAYARAQKKQPARTWVFLATVATRAYGCRVLSCAQTGKPAAAAEPDSVYLQNVIPTGHPDSINTPYRGLVTRDGWKYVCFENRSWLLST